MTEPSSNSPEEEDHDDTDAAEENDDVEMDDVEMHDPSFDIEGSNEIITQGVSFETIVNIGSHPPHVKDMEQVQNEKSIFMIAPFKYDLSHPEYEPEPIKNYYTDRWDDDHVHMPCSPSHHTRHRKSIWLLARQSLTKLRNMCDTRTATVEDLKRTIGNSLKRGSDMDSLEKLINEVYSNDERAYFMSIVLSNICSLVLDVETICSRPPPLLRIGSNRSVTMSQKQAASLLACAFFCLFPFRSENSRKYNYKQYPNPNFNRLYQKGHPKKIEKLKCIFHYFQRITQNMPTGVITFQRFQLPDTHCPKWADSKIGLCDLHLTTGKKIEDIHNVLQVDFANKFIGGGVLGSGCVQEEIRFSICPEMLVSLLVCEKMESNECVFLIGCERYSSYKGYSDSFQFDEDYVDCTDKDNWGRKWCHLVAMDAIFFRNPSSQYDMDCVNRELLKAFTSFLPLEQGSDYEFPIATGNWGCGAFNGDKYVKAIIQLMAASVAKRPLIYAAYRDKKLVDSFTPVYEVLRNQNATVGDLYRYLQRYFTQMSQGSFFEFILSTRLTS